MESPNSTNCFDKIEIEEKNNFFGWGIFIGGGENFVVEILKSILLILDKIEFEKK